MVDSSDAVTRVVCERCGTVLWSPSLGPVRVLALHRRHACAGATPETDADVSAPAGALRPSGAPGGQAAEPRQAV